MARSLEEIELELARLQAEVAAMKRVHAKSIEEIAGRLTVDGDWAAVMDEIEEHRKSPDLEL